MRYYSFVANLIHCKKDEWKNAIPLDLGESPRFQKHLAVYNLYNSKGEMPTDM